MTCVMKACSNPPQARFITRRHEVKDHKLLHDLFPRNVTYYNRDTLVESRLDYSQCVNIEQDTMNATPSPFPPR